MKKFLLIMLGMVLTFSALSRDIEYTYKDQTLIYTVISEDEKTVSVKSCTCSYGESNQSSVEVKIPPTVLDSIHTTYRVTSISSHAFFSRYDIVSVSIPNSVVSICDYAFSNCSNLKEFILEDGTESITFDIKVFEGVSLETLYLGRLFSYNGNILNYAPFYYQSALTSLTIGKYVTSIARHAFQGCSGLTSVSIPSSVTIIDTGAFSGCSGLASISIPSSVNAIGAEAFLCCTSLTSVTIPNSVKTIGGAAFKGCSNLTSITIPDSVTNIEPEVFKGCSRLTSVSIPHSVTTIGTEAFQGCSDLTSVTIPNSVISIGNYAFDSCSNLPLATIPNSVITIGEYAFWNCTKLTSVTIDSSVTSIGEGAFAHCLGLKEFLINKENDIFSSVDGVLFDKKITKLIVFPAGKKVAYYDIPTSVTSISPFAFYGCSNLSTVTIPNSVNSIGRWAFRDCSGLSSVTIPNSVFTIYDYAFSGCISLVSVKIPTSVTSIGEGTFYGCCSLSSIIIPNSITSINGGTFYGCTSLSSITIPNSVNSINPYAFSECCNISSVFYSTENPIEGDPEIFKDSYENATLYVPEEAVEKCKKISPWADFKKIEAYNFNCGIENIVIGFDEDSPYEIYLTNGIRINNDLSNITPGIYIARKHNTTKIIVIK